MRLIGGLRTEVATKLLQIVQLLGIVIALAGSIYANEVRAQMPAGTIGWESFVPSAPKYQTPEEACKAQYDYFHFGVLARFIGASPPGDDWIVRGCKWTSFQYLCPEETGGGISGCGTVLPSYVQFYCDTGYTATIGNLCQKNEDLTPERPCACADDRGRGGGNYNNGGGYNPTAGHPITLSSGSKTLTAMDFETDDGMFSIGRAYRSMQVGRSVNAQSFVRGLAGGWALDFSYELQLRTFSGSTSSPNAKLALIAPDGSGYDFIMQSGGTWIPDTATGAVYAPTNLKLEYVGTLPSNLADIMTSSSDWRLTDGNDTVWEFATYPGPNSGNYAIGRPVTLTTRTGYVWTFAYGSDTRLISITDSYGRQADFNWYQFFVTSLGTPPSGSLPFPEAISSIDLPDGTSLKFTYDPAPATSAPSTSTIARLIKVERLSSLSAVLDSHIYHYEDASFPTHVTGITDNRNIRIATYAYDDRGRGILSELANATDSYAIDYAETSTDLTRTITNPLGKEIAFTFDRFGSGAPDIRLVQVDQDASTNSPAGTSTVTYGVNKFIATRTDEEGRVTTYTRDSKGRPTTIVEATGTAQARTTNITWDSTLNLPLTTVRPGLTETRTYNGLGQLATLTQTDTTTHTTPYSTYGRTHIWTYDWTTTGLLESVDGPLPGTGDTVGYTYSGDGYLDTTTDQVGHTTSITSRNGRGDPLTTEDENGIETVMTYDGMGRPLTVTVNPGPAQSQYVMTYDAAGNLTKLTSPGGGWLEYTYDDDSRVTGIENDRGETQTYTLNEVGEVVAEVIKNATPMITRQQGSAYDELGRIMQSIGAGSQTWAFEYDKADNLTKTTDARTKEWDNGWDPLNRVIEETDPEAASVNYAYAPNDGLTQFRDARNLATNRIVDGFGLTIFEHSPDRGDITYEYDEANRLTQMTDAKGQVTAYTYDDADRQLSETFTGASGENIAYTYDSVSGGNIGIGRLTGVTDASGSSALVYDDQGRLITDTKTIDSETYAVGYAYDSNGLITAITYPSGHIVTYTRASDGKVTAASAKPSVMGSSTNLATSVAFAPFGPLMGLTYGNGLLLARTYDQNYWLTGIALTNSSTPVLGLTFARNANGDLTGVTDTASTGRAATFSYTDASRLANGTGAWGDNDFSYDTAGNRGLVTIENGATDFTELAKVADTSNRVNGLYVDGGPLTTDPHYTSGTSYTYSYNARQRMIGLKLNGTDIASYNYDYAGLRVLAAQLSGTLTSIHYIYAPDGHLLAEHDGATGDVIREYVWLDDMPLALISGSMSSPTYHYVHTGQINEPLMVTDGSKATFWDAAIDPWGKAVMLSTASTTLDLRLPGQWAQSESGLSQNWMRDYDPVLGRYAQADPLGIEGGQNLDAYVENNPLNYADATGLQRGIPIPRGASIPFPIPGSGQPDRNHNGIGDWDESGAKRLGNFLEGCLHAIGLGGDDEDYCEIQKQYDDLECNQWNIDWQGTGYGRKEGYAICLKTVAERAAECRARGGDVTKITTPLFLPRYRRGISEPKRSPKREEDDR